MQRLLKQKATIGLSVFFLISLTVASAQNQIPPAEKLFQSKCAKCHGNDGTKEKAGAKNLHLSKLADAEIIAMIENGKKGMPSFKKKFSPDEIKLLAEYIKSLRR